MQLEKRKSSEFGILSHTQEVSLFQLLLLCGEFMTITKYLILFHRTQELMLFCIRFSTSANFLLHRDNKTGYFSSSTAYSEISRYYYYSKYKPGVSMKTVDFKVLFKCSVPSSSSDSSASLHSSLDKGSLPLESSVDVADDDEDDEDEDDERFKVDNISYFKDRSSVLVGENKDRKELNYQRMNEAIEIFFITVKYYLINLYHPSLSGISTEKTKMLQSLKEIILCRPLLVHKAELINFVETVKEEYSFLSNEILSEVFSMINNIC
jgi:hypothetical protein